MISITTTLLVEVFFLALLMEYIDAALGGGFGTLLTPALLFVGFEPLEVIPVLLFSQALSGIWAGFCHQSLGNVYFSFRTFSRDSKISLLMFLTGIVGISLAALLAITLPPVFLKIYIVVVLLMMGIFLWERKMPYRFSWKKVGAIGLLGSFNKGMSAGGYGPIGVGGLILSGVEPREAVGTIITTEGVISLVGFLVYYASYPVEWVLAVPILLGSFLAVPFSSYTIKKIPEKLLKKGISIFMLVLAFVLLLKILI